MFGASGGLLALPKKENALLPPEAALIATSGSWPVRSDRSLQRPFDACPVRVGHVLIFLSFFSRQRRGRNLRESTARRRTQRRRPTSSSTSPVAPTSPAWRTGNPSSSDLRCNLAGHRQTSTAPPYSPGFRR
jgi:hypothetical protein